MSSVNPLEEMAWPPQAETPAAEVVTEPAQEVEDKPAVTVDVEPEKPKDDPETKYRNLQAALREEREEKKRLKAQIEEISSKTAGLEELRKQLDEQRRAAQEAAEKAKFEEDPANYLKSELERVRQEQEKLQHQTVEERQAQERETQFLQAVSSQVQSFKTQTPDYDEAFQYAHDRRIEELRILGIPEQNLEAVFVQESFALANQAMQQGRNPGEVVYQLAKHWGYKNTPKESPEKTIERLEAGQKAAKTLNGGASPSVTLKDIEQMSEAEFDKYWAEIERNARLR